MIANEEARCFFCDGDGVICSICMCSLDLCGCPASVVPMKCPACNGQGFVPKDGTHLTDESIQSG